MQRKHLMTLFLTLAGQLCLTQAMQHGDNAGRVPLINVNAVRSSVSPMLTPRTPHDVWEHTRKPQGSITYINDTPRKIEYALLQSTPRAEGGGVFYSSPRPPAVQMAETVDTAQKPLKPTSMALHEEDKSSSSSSDSDDSDLESDLESNTVEKTKPQKRQKHRKRGTPRDEVTGDQEVGCCHDVRQRWHDASTCKKLLTAWPFCVLIPYIGFVVAALTGEENFVTEFGPFRFMCGIAYNENIPAGGELNDVERANCGVLPLFDISVEYWALVGICFIFHTLWKYIGRRS